MYSRQLPIGIALIAACAACYADSSAKLANVAFVSIRSGDPQIYTRDDLGRIQAVTQGKALPGQPAWGVDGRLAYIARVGPATRVFVTDAAGGAARRLTGDERAETSPSWSPDGRAVAFYSRPVDGGETELRIVAVDSGAASVIARDAREMGPTPPSWSADGSRLAFSLNFDRDRAHVWVVQRDGSGLRNLTARQSPRGAAWPNLSPDGRNLVWIADMRGRMPVVVTDVESGQSHELTPEANASAESPRWSPDGRKIVFASTRDSLDLGRNDVFVMDPDGSNVRNLSRHPGEDFDPKWSADGRSVVFASLRSGTSLLYEVSLFNGRAQPVSEHASHDMDHAVRPVAAAK